MTPKIPSWLANSLETDIVPALIELHPASGQNITRKNDTMAYEESLIDHAYPLQVS